MFGNFKRVNHDGFNRLRKADIPKNRNKNKHIYKSDSVKKVALLIMINFFIWLMLLHLKSLLLSLEIAVFHSYKLLVQATYKIVH